MNMIHNYNMKMGRVDLSDQLIWYYRIDNGVRYSKWWWSIWFWAVGVMLTNVWIMYVKVNQNRYIKKDLLSHHEFLKAIALAWINPKDYNVDSTIPFKRIPASLRKWKSTGESSAVFSITMDSSLAIFKNSTQIWDLPLEPYDVL